MNYSGELDYEEFLEKVTQDINDQDSFIYGGEMELPEWGVSPFAHHRDSDLLDESNFDTISTDLIERFPDDFEIERFGHWAVGWVENLRIRLRDEEGDEREEAIYAAMVWYNKLQNYPVADEDDYSRRESEARDEAFEDSGKYFLNRLSDEEKAGMPLLFDEDGEIRKEALGIAQRYWDDNAMDRGEAYADETRWLNDLIDEFSGPELGPEAAQLEQWRQEAAGQVKLWEDL